MKIKKSNVDIRQLQEEFFKMITEEASEFRELGTGPSYGYLYGRLTGLLQDLMWVPEVQEALQRNVAWGARKQAKLAVPAESI